MSLHGSGGSQTRCSGLALGAFDVHANGTSGRLHDEKKTNRCVYIYIYAYICIAIDRDSHTNNKIKL